MQDEGAGIYQQAPAYDPSLGQPAPWAQYRENNWMIFLTLILGAFVLYGVQTEPSLSTVHLKDLKMSPEEYTLYMTPRKDD